MESATGFVSISGLWDNGKEGSEGLRSNTHYIELAIYKAEVFSFVLTDHIYVNCSNVVSVVVVDDYVTGILAIYNGSVDIINVSFVGAYSLRRCQGLLHYKRADKVEIFVESVDLAVTVARIGVIVGIIRYCRKSGRKIDLPDVFKRGESSRGCPHAQRFCFD